MKITVYRTQNCQYCHMLVTWLENQRFEIESKFVDKDQSIKDEMLSLSNGYRKVPFTVITQDDGSVLTVEGYDRMKLSQLLGITQVV